MNLIPKMDPEGATVRPDRITSLRVENFRAVRNVEFRNLTPLTVLLGPDGSGKSTVFDVFAFLSECFESGLRRAWERRGGARELKSRGSDGPLVIEIKYKEPEYPTITYHLAVDEPSREAFLREMLPKMLQGRATFAIRAYQGKRDLLRKLEQRLRGYAHWLPESGRIIVLLDRDDDDCHRLKQAMEQAASQSGLSTRSTAGGAGWRAANRVAVEELEAWFFSEWAAVHEAYPRASTTVPAQAAYRNPDAIKGGTWEAFERVLKAAGYFNLGLRKVEAARAIGRTMCADANTSRSFGIFRAAVPEAVGS